MTRHTINYGLSAYSRDQQEKWALANQNDYYRRALQLIAGCVKLPVEQAADPMLFYKELSRCLMKAPEIAVNALNGKPLEPGPIATADVVESIETESAN